jgi:hypothetical protein
MMRFREAYGLTNIQLTLGSFRSCNVCTYVTSNNKGAWSWSLPRSVTHHLYSLTTISVFFSAFLSYDVFNYVTLNVKVSDR